MRLVAAAVLLAILAGCSGFADPTETTVTPAPVPDPIPIESADRGPVPGVDGGGPVDAARLARAHTNATANRSYYWTERTVPTRLANNTTETTRTTLRVEHERRYRYDFATSLLYGNTSECTQGDTRYRREFGNYIYRRAPPTTVTERFGDRPAGAIRRYLAVSDPKIEPVRVNGRRHYRLVGRTPMMTTGTSIRNYTVTAVISPTGFVRHLLVTYNVGAGEQRRRIEYQYGYRNVGETRVRPPMWVIRRWPDFNERGEANITYTDAIEQAAWDP